MQKKNVVKRYQILLPSNQAIKTPQKQFFDLLWVFYKAHVVQIQKSVKKQKALLLIQINNVYN